MNDDRPEDGDGVIAGRYELGPLIGAGATARVHRAVDRDLGREVAVKVYDHHVVAADGLRRARERTLLASIDHPRVVAVYDSGTEENRPYLVLQLVDGPNLAERLLAGPLPAEEVRELALGLADALAHVHARQIVHRDLKPANILLGAGGPLLTDFGIAQALDSTRITGTGLVTGTAAYLAPEQILGEQAGPPADIYALGLILLECLTAQREFPGTMAESAIARLHREPRIPAETPAQLANALRRMTAREPTDRPAADEVLRLLTTAAEASPAAAIPARLALAAAGASAAEVSPAAATPARRWLRSAATAAASPAVAIPARRVSTAAETSAAEASLTVATPVRLASAEPGAPAAEASLTVATPVRLASAEPGAPAAKASPTAATPTQHASAAGVLATADVSPTVTTPAQRASAELAAPAAATVEGPPTRARRRASAAAGVVAAAAAGVLAVVLAHPAEPADSPARLPEAAPPSTSAPSRVTVALATTVVVVSSQAARPVTVGVVGAVPSKAGAGKPRGGPEKPGGGPHGEPGKAAGPGGGPGRR